MKKFVKSGVLFLLLMSVLLLSSVNTFANPPQREYYEIRIYKLSTSEQEQQMDAYLKDALLPALHRSGIKKAGVFKPIGNDTAALKKIYLLIPYRSLNDIESIETKLGKDKDYQAAGKDYIDALHDKAPYTRYSRTILKAFEGMPQLGTPKLTAPKKDRVYELRSYESATEKLYKRKVKMFNTGDEVGIFKRLGFNAVFYAEVIAGDVMPNLVYMTTFENMPSRDEHWKAFGDDPAWNKLKADKQYDNTVSHIDTYFLYPTEYSDL